MLWDFICDEPPPPLPQLPPAASGGQCDVPYRVVVAYGAAPGEFPADNGFSTTREFVVNGTIKGIRRRENAGNVLVQLAHGVAGDPDTVALSDVWSFMTAAYVGDTSSIVSIERLDGLPDECGELEPEYPYVEPQPDDLNFPITVNIDGVNVNFDVNIPVTVFPPDVTFRPQFNVNMGDIRITMDFDGIDISFPEVSPPPRIPDGTDPRPTPTQPPPVNVPGEGFDSVVCPSPDLSGIMRALNQIFNEVNEVEEVLELLLDCDRCEIPPVNDPRYGVATYPPADSGVIDTQRGGKFVTIELVEIPSNPRRQEGLRAPDVYYAGWYSFGSDRFSGERGAIRYQFTSLRVPEGMTNFTYTLYPGFKAIIKTYQLTR